MMQKAFSELYDQLTSL